MKLVLFEFVNVFDNVIDIYLLLYIRFQSSIFYLSLTYFYNMIDNIEMLINYLINLISRTNSSFLLKETLSPKS